MTTRHFISRSEVIRMLEIEEDFLVSLESEEIVVGESDGSYASATVERIRVCRSLHHELGVNFAGLEVALQLLETIEAERSQFHEVLRLLKSQLNS